MKIMDSLGSPQPAAVDKTESLGGKGASGQEQYGSGGHRFYSTESILRTQMLHADNLVRSAIDADINLSLSANPQTLALSLVDSVLLFLAGPSPISRGPHHPPPTTASPPSPHCYILHPRHWNPFRALTPPSGVDEHFSPMSGLQMFFSKGCFI